MSTSANKSRFNETLQVKLDNNCNIVNEAVDCLDEKLCAVCFYVSMKLFPNRNDLTTEKFTFIGKTILQRCLKIEPASTGLCQVEFDNNYDVIKNGVSTLDEKLHEICCNVRQRLFLDENWELNFFSETILKKCLERYSQ